MLNSPHEESQPILNLVKKCPEAAPWFGVYPDYLTTEITIPRSRGGATSHLRPDDLERIKQLFLSGKTRLEVALECGVSYATVTRQVKGL